MYSKITKVLNNIRKIGIAKAVVSIAVVGTLGVAGVTMLAENEVVEDVNDIIQDEVSYIEPVVNTHEETISEYREILEIYSTALLEAEDSMDSFEMAELLSQRLNKYEPNNMYQINAFGSTELYYGLFDLNGDDELEMVITFDNPLQLTGEYDDFIMESIWTCSDNDIKHLVDRTWGQIKLYDNSYIVVHYADGDSSEIIWMNYSSVDGKYNFEKAVIQDYNNEFTVTYDKNNFEACNKEELVDGNFYDTNNIQWYKYLGINNEDLKLN